MNIHVTAIEPRHVTLADLEKNDCRFPFGDSRTFTFCGHPQVDGSSYCAEHTKLCWLPPRGRK